MAAVLDSSELEEFRRELAGLSVPVQGVQVKRADIQEIRDSTGDTALHATLFVVAPIADTWAVDQYMAVREAVNELAQRVGIDLWVYVDLAVAEAEVAERDSNGERAADEAAERQVDEQLAKDASREHDT